MFKIYTNFDHAGGNDTNTEGNVLRKKPLMYFCFDLLGDNDEPSNPDKFQTQLIERLQEKWLENIIYEFF